MLGKVYTKKFVITPDLKLVIIEKYVGPPFFTSYVLKTNEREIFLRTRSSKMFALLWKSSRSKKYWNR
jgi:hypothetical protein